MLLRLGFALLACCTALAFQEVSSDDLLPRIQQKIAEHVVRLPNYVCSEVIQRFERSPLSQDLQRIDTVRVEVAVIDGRERFAWPGSSDYAEMDLGEMVGNSSGGIAQGDFVLHARNIFLDGKTVFGEVRTALLDGRPAIQVTYRVPTSESTYLVWSNGKSSSAGYHGSVWVEPTTLDLMRIEVVADELQAASKIASASSLMDYARIRMGDSDQLLPKRSQLLMKLASGKELFNRTDFTGYRRFEATSSISFDHQLTWRVTGTATIGEVELPPGLRLKLKLETNLDSDHATVGDPIYASVVQPVVVRGRTLLPRGARVSGRIRKLERHFDPWSYYIVGLEFSEVELQRERARFRGQMEQVQLIPGMLGTPSVSPAVETEVVRTMPLGPPQIPNTGIFLMVGNRVSLPKGLEFRWKTIETKK